jgi:hypothetical protein
MLPSMFANTKRNLIAGVTAVAVLAAGTSPALAWGKNEQQFLAGVVSTLVVGAIIRDIRQQNAAQQPVPTPRYHRPVRYQPAPVSIYGTPAGLAFNSYTDNEQRRIQSTLTAYGYYHGGIDGSFGPGTYAAITAYARHTNKVSLLNSRAGAYSVLDGLLF